MFRLRPAQAEAVRDWARARRIKLQPMIQLALEELMAAGMPAERYVKSSKKVHAAVKKVVSKETQSTYNLHIVELDEWVDWVIMVLDNPIDTYAIEALADNIIGFLAALARRKDRMLQAGLIHGADKDTIPDYAAAAEAAYDSLEQLRRLFERMRKSRSTMVQE